MGTRNSISWVFTLVIIIFGLVIKSSANLPQNNIVTNLADSGPGTLRQVLEAACPGAKITFAVEGTIFLTSGPLLVDKDINIIGPCAQKLSINPQQRSPAFVITNCASATISDLTITNGQSSGRPTEGNGGGIRNFATLNLTRVVVTECSADAIGGGIYNAGELNLRQCSISNNSAALAGGIGDDGFGRLTIDSSTISLNSAAFPEGTQAGGIYKVHNIALLTNTTISGNRVIEGSGGGIAAFCFFRLESCTIASNSVSKLEQTFTGKGGGIFLGVGGAVEMRNTIIAGNTVFLLEPFTTNASDISGTVCSQGYNLIGNPCGSVIAGLAIGNLIGVNPLLGPLQDNGGPTFTHALLTGSPAIDAGSPYDFPPTDQRGIARPQDGNGVGKAITDIGAYEKETVIPGDIPGKIIVTSLANSGPGTLREALEIAPRGAKITFAVEGTIVVLDESLLITKNVKIAGPGADKLSLTGFSPVFVVSNCVKASLLDVMITNAFRVEFGPGGFGGGAIRNFGDFTMTRCVINHCGSEFGLGGGIYTEGDLTLHQCTISNNSTEFGGGIGDVGDGRLVVDRCTINNNRAINGGGFEGLGGGICKFIGLMWMSNSTVSANSVFNGDGGGLATQGAYVFVDNSTIVSNQALSIENFGRGGGLFKLDTGTVEMRNTIVAGNSAQSAAFSPQAFSVGPDVFGCIFSQGWNLVQNPSNAFFFEVLTGNIFGKDPRLGPLTDNGGPTLTHALLTGSPAIDAGSPFTFLLIDQRGVPRPQDGNGDGVAIGDIGAFEKEAPLPPCLAKIESIRVDENDHVCVIGTGVPGQLYTVESTDSLTSPNWVALPVITAAPSGILQVTDTRPRALGTRYYRTVKISEP